METKLYLIRMGEIALKGLNRDFFEKRLRHNIKEKLRPWATQCSRQKGRLFLEVDKSCPNALINQVLSTTFGVVGFAPALRCKKDFEAIKEAALELIQQPPFSEGTGTFKVEARRADKSFPLTSYDIACELGGVVLDTYEDMKVNVKNPQYTLFVEIRDSAYLYTSPLPGPSGLPVGCAGRGLLLLSGGIDSPVAAWRMAMRGMKLECIYFHAYPYTSHEALEKVKDLARLIAPYLQGTRLHVISFTEAQLWIKQHSREEAATLMMRAAMMKVANSIADEQNLQALVTGEALSQVASQTLESMSFTDSMSERIVLRPLVGMSKEEIVSTARHINTYETSILPYEDCCVIFSPKHPIVRPNKDEMTLQYESMNIETILADCIANREVFDIMPLEDYRHFS